MGLAVECQREAEKTVGARKYSSNIIPGIYLTVLVNLAKTFLLLPLFVAPAVIFCFSFVTSSCCCAAPPQNWPHACTHTRMHAMVRFTF